jgi:hypothetical protein
MTDLGYPESGVKMVQNLNTGATTSVQTSFGPTTPINIHRGTIQGDSLSPYPFISCQPVGTHPPKEAFKYLGIYMTIDLNRTSHFENTISKLQRKLHSLTSSWMS